FIRPCLRCSSAFWGVHGSCGSTGVAVLSRALGARSAVRGEPVQGGVSWRTSCLSAVFPSRRRRIVCARGSCRRVRGVPAGVWRARDPGRPGGLGFVERATSGGADRAVKRLNGKDLEGRQRRVERGRAWEGGARRSFGGGGGSRGGFGGSRGNRW